MARKKKTEFEKRRDVEVKRLEAIFEHVDEKKVVLVESLIKRAAFMRITLENFEEDLRINGSIELFSQSENVEAYERERPTARLYNTMNKNYQSIMKQLYDVLPKSIEKEESDGFDDFISNRCDS